MNLQQATNLYFAAKFMRDTPQEDLALDEFDFDVLVDKHSCGTVGCFMGHLPQMFPKEFEFKYSKDVCFVESLQEINLEEGIGRLFGLNNDERDILFYPIYFDEDRVSQYELPPNSTKEEVAQNLINFIVNEKGFKIEKLEARTNPTNPIKAK